MGRQGIPCDQILEFLQDSGLDNLIIEGVATHFTTMKDKIWTFYATRKNKKQQSKSRNFGTRANIIMANALSASRLNRCRIGMCWLLSPYRKTLWEKSHSPLKPVMSVFTKVTQIKEVPAGNCISYGCTYRTENNAKLATIPVGYFEGLPRSLSNQGYVWIKNKTAPIVGRVCMDITVIDISKIENVKIGDEVEIIGDNINVEDLAQIAQTINYEILTNWKESLPRLVC